MTKIKKFKAKSHKGTVKRIKITKGKDPFTGVLMIDRINNNHRNIGKKRERLLKGRRSTKLKKMYNKLRSVL